MAVGTPDELNALLAEGRETELRGMAEQDWLDFKGQPYILKIEKHRWELAKDVANMASNPTGGCLALGFVTKKDPDDFEEILEEINPFPGELVNDKEYREAIDSFVYPQIRSIQIRQHRRETQFLALIVVPPQEDDDRPFILKRQVTTDGGIIDAFAFPSRDGSQTRWLSVGQVHRDLSDGRRSRRSSLPSVAAPPRRAPPGGEVAARLHMLVDGAERFMDWADTAVYALAAVPANPPDRIRDFYGNNIAAKFFDPPRLRDAGFGIGWTHAPQVEEGSLVASDSRRYRRLDPDGFFISVTNANDEFLGRSNRRSQAPAAVRVNTTVLVEYTYEFCRFTSSALAPAVGTDWSLVLLVRGARTRPWRLVLGPRNASFTDEFRLPSSDDWERHVVASLDPERDAFEVLARFYDLFSLPESEIPFSQDRRVNPEEIVALGG